MYLQMIMALNYANYLSPQVATHYSANYGTAAMFLRVRFIVYTEWLVIAIFQLSLSA